MVGTQGTLLQENKTYICFFLLSDEVLGESLVLLEDLLAIGFRPDDYWVNPSAKLQDSRGGNSYSRTRGTRGQLVPTRDPSSQE